MLSDKQSDFEAFDVSREIDSMQIFIAVHHNCVCFSPETHNIAN